MLPRPCLLAVCLAFALSACSHTVGRSYLKSEQYARGIRVFQAKFSKNPDDPTINYYLGRFYLAEERPEQALSYLSRAARLDPGEAEIYFWVGVAHWALMDFQAERRNYQRALALDEDHIPARLYLAHNFLDNGQWQDALGEYNKVLLRDRYNPEALYNRGLALQQLDKPTEEIAAWKEYLLYYPEGRWGLRATDHLNSLGDFSYRNFTIGYRRVTLERLTFKPESAEPLSKSKPSLLVVGSILRINKRIELEVVGYKSGEPDLATARAKAVRDHLIRYFPDIDPSRLKYRGQGHEEEVEINQRTYKLKESISFVTTKK